jgi:hypothetical protein
MEATLASRRIGSPAALSYPPCVLCPPLCSPPPSVARPPPHKPRPSRWLSTSPTPRARFCTPQRPSRAARPAHARLSQVDPRRARPGRPHRQPGRLHHHHTRWDGERIKWERDPVNMFAYHLTVPAGVTELHIKMDFLATAAPSGFSAGASTSANLALLSWNELLVYPPSRTSPTSWSRPPSKSPPTGSSAPRWTPAAAIRWVSRPSRPSPSNSSSTRPSSPAAGSARSPRPRDHAQSTTSTSPATAPRTSLLSQEHIDNFSKLIRETGALYKSRHYGSYHFLVTLSDQVAHFGLEHHQSSDDRVPHSTFVGRQRLHRRRPAAAARVHA